MRHVQTLAISKNPQFLLYSHETLWKWLSHKLIIFTKFHEDRTKNADFLLMANLWTRLGFFTQTLPHFKEWHDCLWTSVAWQHLSIVLYLSEEFFFKKQLLLNTFCTQLVQSCIEKVVVWVFPNHESKMSDLENPPH